jgi:hypothetical protein
VTAAFLPGRVRTLGLRTPATFRTAAFALLLSSTPLGAGTPWPAFTFGPTGTAFEIGFAGTTFAIGTALARPATLVISRRQGRTLTVGRRRLRRTFLLGMNERRAETGSDRKDEG